MFKDKRLASILWGYYPVHSLILFAHVFGWQTAVRGQIYYPQGAMQAIPNAAAAAIRRHGGEVLLNCEVEQILVRDGRAVGVRCTDGRVFYADVVISNAPIHHTLSKLLAGVPGLGTLKAEIEKRRVFTSGVFVFLGVDQNYDFGGINSFPFLEEDTIDIPEEQLTPQTSPVGLIIPPKSEGQVDYSAILTTVLPYEYENRWQTGDSRKREKPYYQLKRKVKDILLNRVCDRLGEDFREAIRYSLAATPLTFERYTYNAEGAWMGWRMDRAHFGKFIPHSTPIKNLYLMGHWVFPGGGVPAVMAGGCYVAKTILAKEGIDLEERLRTFARSMS